MKNSKNYQKGGLGGIIGAVVGIALVVASAGTLAGVGVALIPSLTAGGAAATVVGGLAVGAAGYGVGSLFDKDGNPIQGTGEEKTTCDPSKEDCSGGSAPGEEALQEADPTNNPDYCLAVIQHLSAISNATAGIDEEMKKTQKELDIAKLALERAKGASTAISTANTTTTTSSSTLADLAPLAVSVSPNVLHVGDSATFYVTINNSITSYSLDLYKNGQLAGTLAGNQTVLGSARPVTLKFPFVVTPSTQTGDYKIRVLDATNANTFAEASFTIVSNTTPITNQYGTGFTTTGNSNTSVTSNTGLSTVKFLNPYAYGIVPRNKTTNISWSFTGRSDATMNIYANVKCVKKVNVCTSYDISNPTKACTSIKSSCKPGSTVKIPIATNVRIGNQSMKWKVPSKIVDKQAIIYAEQNGKKIGTGQSFYVSY
jgi:hypothetical protein